MKRHVLLPNELKKEAQDMGFSIIEGKVDLGSEINKIEIPNLKDFLEFQVHIDNKLLFFEYEFEYEENYIISDEDQYMYEEYEEIIQSQIRLKIAKHNKTIKEIDFDKPYSLLMYYLKDGFLFYNHTIKDDDSSIYEETLEDIIESAIQEIPEETLEEIKMNRRAETDKEVQQLKELIFVDPKFKTATNVTFRQAYSSRFFKNNPEYRDLLHRANYRHPNLFIEEIWKEFKGKGLHK
ncbi:hypothetical protein V7166_23190 [Bacillus thuringiensis]